MQFNPFKKAKESNDKMISIKYDFLRKMNKLFFKNLQKKTK